MYINPLMSWMWLACRRDAPRRPDIDLAAQDAVDLGGAWPCPGRSATGTVIGMGVCA